MDELENQELITPEEETENSENLESAEGETAEEKVAKLEEANKRLFARAKKAESELKASHSNVKVVETPKVVPQPVGIDVKEIIKAELDERDLSSLELSDELKTEVKAYAKAKSIPYREAAKSEYIKFLSEKEEAKAREVEASASSKGVSKTAKRDFSSLDGEGIKKLDDESFAKYKEWLKSQG